MHVASHSWHEGVPYNMWFRILGPVNYWKRVGLSSERWWDQSLGFASVRDVPSVTCVFLGSVVSDDTVVDLKHNIARRAQGRVQLASRRRSVCFTQEGICRSCA